LKIGLRQLILLCGLFAQILLGPMEGFMGLGWDAVIILALRWVDHGSTAALPSMPSFAHQAGDHRLLERSFTGR
jgi:hypothetical protein